VSKRRTPFMWWSTREINRAKGDELEQQLNKSVLFENYTVKCVLTYEANQPFKHIVVDSKLDIHLNFM